MKCPECKSSRIARLYAAFWAEVDENGEDIAKDFHDHESDTEFTDQAMCIACNHQFEYEE